MPLAADLPVKPAVGFEETLVTQRAIEEHFAIGADFRRTDHRGEHVFELFVEILLDQARQRAVERHAAEQQENGNPPRRDQHHAP